MLRNELFERVIRETSENYSSQFLEPINYALFEQVLREANENNSGLPHLADHIDSILQVISSGTPEQKKQYKGAFFFLSNNTSQELKDFGVIGEFFEVRYGVIARHYNKDKNHCLTAQNLKDLCVNINHPFAIAPIRMNLVFSQEF
jgi:hypothetical protein